MSIHKALFAGNYKGSEKKLLEEITKYLNHQDQLSAKLNGKPLDKLNKTKMILIVAMADQYNNLVLEFQVVSNPKIDLSNNIFRLPLRLDPNTKRYSVTTERNSSSGLFSVMDLVSPELEKSYEKANVLVNCNKNPLSSIFKSESLADKLDKSLKKFNG